MAKQDGFHPVIGTLGKTTFYKTQDGYMARGRTKISAERIAKDPAFKRLRDNMQEFGRAGRAGKVMRTPLSSLLKTTSDKRLIRRMTAEMMKVVKSDSTNRRGSRTVQKGNLALLREFDFNANSLLSVILTAPFAKSVDRAAGTLSVEFQPFIPDDLVKSPVGSTHFKIITAAAEFDFENGKGTADIKESPLVPLGKTPTNLISITCNVPPNSTHPLFLFCGIVYYEEVNGELDLLTGGAFNALQIVEVNTI